MILGFVYAGSEHAIKELSRCLDTELNAVVSYITMR
jgi:hypothetical protein